MKALMIIAAGMAAGGAALGDPILMVIGVVSLATGISSLRAWPKRATPA